MPNCDFYISVVKHEHHSQLGSRQLQHINELMTERCARKYELLSDISGILCILIQFSSIVKQAMFAYVSHARIRSWNQPVLSNEDKVSFSRKHREPCWGSNSQLTGIHRLRVRLATHFDTPLLSDIAFYLVSKCLSVFSSSCLSFFLFFID